MSVDHITCPRCGITTHNPHDVAEGYCSHCHDWTGHPRPDLNLQPGIFDGTTTVAVDPDSAGPIVPPAGPADDHWIVHAAGHGWYAGNGRTGATFPTYTEAAEFAAQHNAEIRLEWGGIMAALDRITGLTYACRHHHHGACPSPAGEWSSCSCPCHQETP